jgi:Exostosin family
MQRLADFRWAPEDIITTDKYKAFIDGQRPIDAVYLKTDIFTTPGCQMAWRGVLHRVENANVWVSGHGDIGISGEVFRKFDGRFQEWWSVNVAHVDPRLHCLPLGITNPTRESWMHPIYSDVGAMLEVAQTTPERTGLIYMNFDRETHTDRKRIWDMFSGKDWVTKGVKLITAPARREYLAALRRHKFCLAPRGNGIDTHRLWESLYMGCIPVVGRDVLVEEFAHDLPILVVDRWEDVTPEFLEEAWERMSAAEWNMDAMRIGYWLGKLRRAILRYQV